MLNRFNRFFEMNCSKEPIRSNESDLITCRQIPQINRTAFVHSLSGFFSGIFHDSAVILRPCRSRCSCLGLHITNGFRRLAENKLSRSHTHTHKARAHKSAESLSLTGVSLTWLCSVLCALTDCIVGCCETGVRCLEEHLRY